MKKILIYVTTLIFIFCLTGCHQANIITAFEIPDNFDTSREYTITFWAKNDSNKEQQQIYADTIARFETYYPNIHVEIQQYSDYSKIYNDVITNISTQTTPNVCITYPDYVATYLEGNNVIVKLDELMNDYKYGFGGSEVAYETIKSSEIVEQYLEECKIENGIYALPFMRSSEVTYVNKTLLESLGYEVPDILTWDFVWEVCAAARAANSSSSFIPLIYKSTDNFLIQLTKQYGIDYTTSDGEILLYNDDLKNLLSTLSEYADNKLFDTFKRVSYPGNFFNRGNCVFAIDSTAGSTWMGSNALLLDIPSKDVAEFETVVLPVPQADANNVKMISQGPSICIFNKKDDQEVLASWLFAQFLLNDETQIAYASTEGYVPVTTSAINNPAYQDYLSHSDNSEEYYSVKMDATKIVLANIQNTFITPVFNGSSSVRNASSYIIESLFANKYKPINDNIDEILNDSKSLYKLDQIKKTNTSKTLPTASKVLILTIATIWLGIAVYTIINKIKNRKSNKLS